MARTREASRSGPPAPQLVPDGLTPNEGGSVRPVTEMEGCGDAAVLELEELEDAFKWVESVETLLAESGLEVWDGLSLPPPAGESPLSVNGEEASELPAARARDASGCANNPMLPPAGGNAGAAATGAGQPAAPLRAPQAHASRASHNTLCRRASRWRRRGQGWFPSRICLVRDSEGRYGVGLCRMPVVLGHCQRHARWRKLVCVCTRHGARGGTPSRHAELDLGALDGR